MATLADIANQLQDNNKSQEETRDAITQLTTTFQNYFVSLQRNRLDDLEYQRNLLNALEDLKAPSPSPRVDTTPRDGGGFPFALALPNLSQLALPALVAFIAEIGSFDEYIKALRVPAWLATFKRSIDVIVDTFDSIGRFVSNLLSRLRLPEIPRFVWLDEAGNIIDDVKLKLPTIPTIQFIDDAGNVISDFIDYKIRLPIINFIDDTGKAITDFIDYKIKLPAMLFIDDAGRVIDNIVDAFKIRLPTIPSLGFVNEAGEIIKLADYVPKFTIPTGLFDSVRTFFVGTEAGGGVLGMFTKIADLITSVPGLKTIFRVIGGPVTQALLSIFDFFRGFYEGFTKTEIDPVTGEEIQRDFADKILAGLEGGFLGLVKGITEAFDLLFFKLPAWLLNKIGAEDAANFLRGFSLTELVDPIWSGVKGIFSFFTDSTYRAEITAGLKEDFKEWIYGFWESIKGLFSGIFAPDPTELNTEGVGTYEFGPQFEQGTQGRFLNFGTGTPAVLHGYEAVVPRESNEGRILSATRSQVVADALTELANSERAGRYSMPGINNVLTDARQTTVVSSSTARINVTPDSHNTAWMMRRGVIPYGR